MMMSLPCRLAAVVSLVLQFLAPARAAEQPGDLWETTSQMSMEGVPMQMPVQKLKICAARNSTKAPGGPDKQNCQNSDEKRVGSKVTWTVKCSPPSEMSGVGEITYDGTDSYTGVIRFTSADGNMTVKLTGRKIGGCDNPQ